MEKLIAYKVEVDLTKEQKEKLIRDKGTCRFIWNLYISRVEEIRNHAKENNSKYKVPTDSEFYRWVMQEYIPETGKTWIKETHNKAIKEVARVCYKTYHNAFKGKCGFPKLKRKSESNEPSVYFVKNDSKSYIISDRHFVKVPGYGRIHLKEKGHIPTTKKGDTSMCISSGRLAYKAGKFYITVVVKYNDVKPGIYKLSDNGVGLDMGIKSWVYSSDGDLIISKIGLIEGTGMPID